MASQQQNRLSDCLESAPMRAMSVLHRAVSELADVTTFHRSSEFAARRFECARWLALASPRDHRKDMEAGHALVSDARANRLHGDLGASGSGDVHPIQTSPFRQPVPQVIQVILRRAEAVGGALRRRGTAL
jgi:hypothetical protein